MNMFNIFQHVITLSYVQPHHARSTSPQVRLDRDQQDGLSRATVRVLKCRQAGLVAGEESLTFQTGKNI